MFFPNFSVVIFLTTSNVVSGLKNYSVVVVVLVVQYALN